MAKVSKSKVVKKIIQINGDTWEAPPSAEKYAEYLGHRTRTKQEIEDTQEKLYTAVSEAPSDVDEMYLMQLGEYIDNLPHHYENSLRYQELELVRVQNIIGPDFDDITGKIWVPIAEPDTTGLWLPVD